MGIKSQLTAAIAAVILISVSIPTFFIAKDAEKEMLSDIQSRAELMINYMQGSVVDPLIAGDDLKLSSLAYKVSQSKGVIYVIITDHTGAIRGSSGTKDLEKSDGAKKTAREFLGDAVDTPGPVKVSYNNREYSVFNHIAEVKLKVKEEGETVLGKIYLGVDRQVIESRITRFYLKACAIAFFILCMSIFLISALTGVIIKPLLALMKGTEMLAAGDMDYRIKVKVKNEFQAVANGFNAMTEKLRAYYDGILNAFIATIDTIDKYTPGHSRRVAGYACELARQLNLPHRQVENIRLAAILKDVGNIGVEKKVLNKIEALTAEDYIEIQKHPEVSGKILDNIEAMREVVPIILQHHERYDGNGYPKGLKGEQIVLEARILAIADAFDAMTTKRGHREAVTPEEAVYELRLNRGMQFDPKLTDTFIMMINKKGGV